MDKYIEYTVTEFLDDNFFKQSVMHPTVDSDVFWNNLIDQNLLDVKEYECAKVILESLVLRRDVESDDEKSLQLWNRLHKSTMAYNNRKKGIHQYFYIASSVACILILVLFYNNLPESQEKALRQIAEVSSANHIDSPTNIRLILAEEKIDLEGDNVTVDYKSADSIRVNDRHLEKDKATYNQLVVPYGKRSFLVLGDGSRIWVNAGSHVIYPTKFSDSKRIIFVKGEIYAEIEKDIKRPFLIVSDNLNIEVLGTSLNVSDYSLDNVSSVVLVEGSVMVKPNATNKKTYILKPNEMLVYANQQNRIAPVDVSNYIAWKDGLYHFENKPLGEVLRVIERYYNVKVKCAEEVFSIKCTGSLDLKEDVNQVIQGVSYAASVDIKQDDDKIIIY